LHVPSAQIQAAIAKKGAMIANVPELGVSIAASGRDMPGNPEMHEGNSEIYYVIGGAATFLSGGTLENAKTSRPGHQSGTAIIGGTTYELKAGDGVVIPPGVPHQFKAVSPQGIQYYVVNANKPR